jgi:hypothetical protein
MAGLVPAIHVFYGRCFKDVDARDKPGHDELMGIDCRNHASAIPMAHRPFAKPPQETLP